MLGVAAEVAVKMSLNQQLKSRQQPAVTAKRRRVERTMSCLELVYKFVMKGGIKKNKTKVDYYSQKNFLLLSLFLHSMSPSTPAIPPINESKMKLYEMFAQKQIAPPPNLSHPGVASSSSSNSKKFVFDNPG